MRLSSLAISKISVRTKNRLALELGCSVQTIERWIKQNEDNGNLTKATALQVIEQETELDQSEILEEVVTQM
jgi:transposase